jgi:class 3 adenylate cyclase
MHCFLRAYGFVIYKEDPTTNAWSTSCVFLQIFVLLGYRYTQEIQARKNFLVQVQILRLQSNLREVLDGMMPRSISERVRAGETVIDAHDHAVVLFCSFPPDTPQTDALHAFLLLDQVHRAFDELLQAHPHARKVDFVGTDYMLATPMPPPERDPSAHGAAAELSRRREACVAIGRLAAQMRARAADILAGSGLALRFAVAAGPAFTVVIGESRRHLRVVGDAVDAARRLCEAAAPWQVLSAGGAAESLRAAGAPMRAVGARGGGGEALELSFDAALLAWAAAGATQRVRRAPSGGTPPLSRSTSLRNLTGTLDANGDGAAPPFSMQAALADMAEAAGRLATGGEASLADPGEEARFRFEAAGGPGGCGGAVGVFARTASVALCQMVFLLGLPGYAGTGAGGAEWAGRLRAWMAAAILVAAVAPAAAAPELAGQGGQWAAMHGVFLGGCVALAHARAEPFLLLGFAMGLSLWFVAPPSPSAAAARWGAGSAYAALLGAMAAASRRDGLSLPGLVAVLPPGLLVHWLAAWLRKEGRAARVLWLLDGRRRRERAALWAALRDLLPEYVLEGLGRGAQMEPHSKQAVVLQAELERVGPGEGGDCADSAAERGRPGLGGAGGAGGEAAVVELHELLTLFDREVRALRGLPPSI